MWPFILTKTSSPLDQVGVSRVSCELPSDSRRDTDIAQSKEIEDRTSLVPGTWVWVGSMYVPGLALLSSGFLYHLAFVPDGIAHNQTQDSCHVQTPSRLQYTPAFKTSIETELTAPQNDPSLWSSTSALIMTIKYSKSYYYMGHWIPWGGGYPNPNFSNKILARMPRTQFQCLILLCIKVSVMVLFFSLSSNKWIEVQMTAFSC